MGIYIARVIIENKEELDDPEADAIFKNLILKKNTNIIKMRTAKILKFIMHEKNKKPIKTKIKKLCNELRLYNPLISTIIIEVFDS